MKISDEEKQGRISIPDNVDLAEWLVNLAPFPIAYFWRKQFLMYYRWNPSATGDCN